MAGVSRMQYPPNARVIRIMCTSRLEPEFILRAFELGADGVLVAGCHIGDCHYISGNEKAVAKIEMTAELLDVLGIDQRRLRLEWISASEGRKFADTMKDFVDRLRELGPSPVKEAAK